MPTHEGQVSQNTPTSADIRLLIEQEKAELQARFNASSTQRTGRSIDHVAHRKMLEEHYATVDALVAQERTLRAQENAKRAVTDEAHLAAAKAAESARLFPNLDSVHRLGATAAKAYSSAPSTPRSSYGSILPGVQSTSGRPIYHDGPGGRFSAPFPGSEAQTNRAPDGSMVRIIEVPADPNIPTRVVNGEIVEK